MLFYVSFNYIPAHYPQHKNILPNKYLDYLQEKKWEYKKIKLLIQMTNVYR